MTSQRATIFLWYGPFIWKPCKTFWEITSFITFRNMISSFFFFYIHIKLHLYLANFSKRKENWLSKIKPIQDFLKQTTDPCRLCSRPWRPCSPAAAPGSGGKAGGWRPRTWRPTCTPCRSRELWQEPSTTTGTSSGGNRSQSALLEKLSGPLVRCSCFSEELLSGSGLTAASIVKSCCNNQLAVPRSSSSPSVGFQERLAALVPSALCYSSKWDQMKNAIISGLCNMDQQHFQQEILWFPSWS